MVNTVVYVRSGLGGSQAAVAIALACYGGGSMIMALAIPRLLPPGRSERPMMLTGAAIAVAGLAAATIWVALTPTGAVGWGTLAAIWIAMGAATSLINTPSARLLRTHSDESNRSAIFTAQFSLSHACFIITYPIAGTIGAVAGQPVAAATLTVLAAAAAVTAYRTREVAIWAG